MYVDYRSHYGYGALGLEASASASGSSAPSTPSETSAMIQGSVPTAAQVDSEWGPFMEAAKTFNFNPSSEMAPSAAVEFLMRAMPAIFESTGIGGPGMAQLAQFASGTSTEFGALARGEYKPLAMVAIKAGAAYACYNLGVDPRVGELTVEVIKDGEFTNKDLEAAGAVGGSIGGATLAGVIGVPPAIGGFVGGLAGQAAGAAVASALKIGGGKTEREQKRRELQARVAAMRGQLGQMRDQMAQNLIIARGEWWSKFDHMVDNFSLQWQGLECNQAFARFPLLWTGDGLPFFRHPFDASLCAGPVNRNLARGTGCLQNGMLLPIINRGGQCSRVYGCEYPVFPSLGASDVWNERVCQAFAAYDIWWQPPGEKRRAVDDLWARSLPSPDARAADPSVRSHMRNESYATFLANQLKAKEGCRSHECRVNADRSLGSAFGSYQAELLGVSSEALSMAGIESAAIRIDHDLVSTASTYAAAAVINAERSSLVKGSLTKAIGGEKRAADLIVKSAASLRQSASFGRGLNHVVNYGMLLTGGALLGAALMKGRR